MATTRRLRRLASHLARTPRSSSSALVAPASTAAGSHPSMKPWQLPGAPPEAQAELVDEDIDVLDYAYSFITNPGAHSPPAPTHETAITSPPPHPCHPTDCDSGPGNAVRFWIESRTILIDDNSGERTVIYQCASCKSENTFGSHDLFAADNCQSSPSSPPPPPSAP